jgi:uncharacterized membrane protein YgcG
LVSENIQFGSAKSAALFAAALALILVLYWLPELSGSASFFVSDHTYYFEPFSRFIGEAFRQGRLPLWNPYLYCGMSQLSVPSPGIFYPTNFLFAITSYSQAVASQMLLHQLLAGFGLFLLVSSFGWGRAPSAVAGLVMALSGYMFALTTNCTIAFSASFLPITLWSFRSIAYSTQSEDRIRRWWYMVVASISIFMLVAAGRPEVFAPGLCFVATYCIIEGLLSRKRGVDFALVINSWLYQLCACLTGLALTMPILLPVAEWASLSPRANGLPVGQVLMWSTNGYDLACMLFPQPFGDLLVLGSSYLKLVATRPTFYPYITSLFIGPVCFSLAIWGFFDRTWLWRKWVVIGCLIFLIICLGEFTPVAPFLVRTFSFLSVLRYPIKLMIFPIILLSVAAARGSKVLIANEVSKAARITVLSLWIFALVIGLTFLCLWQFHIVLPAKASIPPMASFNLGRSIIGSSVIGLLCYLAAHLNANGRFSRKHCALLVIIGIAANLTAVAFCNKQMTARHDFYEHKQTVDSWISDLEKSGGSSSGGTGGGADHSSGSGGGRFLKLYFDPLETPTDYKFDANATWTVNFFSYARDLMLCNTTLDGNRRETFGYEASETGAYREMILSVVHRSGIEKASKAAESDHRLLDLPLLHLCQSTGTRYVGSQVYKRKVDIRVLNPDYFEVMREDRKFNLRLYQVKGATPRCYFSENWRWIKSAPEAMKSAVQLPGALHYAPLSMPLVEIGSAAPVPRSFNALAPEIPKAPEKAPESPYPDSDDIQADRLDRSTHPVGEVRDASLAVASQAPNSSVTIMVDNPEHVSVSVVNKKPGFVVLCDHFYPGWCAFVDSVQVPLYKVNCEMRGVYLPAGTHLIEFDFRSESLKNGLMIAGGGLFLIFCYLFFAAWPSIWRFVKSTAGQ